LALVVLVVTLVEVVVHRVLILFSARSHQMVVATAEHNQIAVQLVVQAVAVAVVRLTQGRLELLDKVLLAVLLVVVALLAAAVAVVHQQLAATERMVEMVARAVLVQHQASQVLL
jgi:hypothetical protein